MWFFHVFHVFVGVILVLAFDDCFYGVVVVDICSFFVHDANDALLLEAPCCFVLFLRNLSPSHLDNI